MKRKEKIEILKAIQSGKMSIEELTPDAVVILVQISTSPSLFEGKGRTYTEAELDKYLSNLKGSENKVILLKIDTDCEPINI